MPNGDTPHIILNSMIFKTWITDLTKVQGVVNNIKNINVWANGSTRLLDPNVVNDFSSAINGLNLQQAKLVLSTRNLTQEQINQVLVQAGLIASEDKIQAELVQSALAQAGLSAEMQKAVLKKLNLIDVTTGEIIATKTCTKEELLNALAAKNITGANAEAIISILGLSGASKKGTLSFSLFTAATWAQVKAQLALIAANPTTWIMAAVAAIAIATSVYKQLSKVSSEVAEKAQELGDSLKTTKSDIQNYITQIEELNKTIKDSDSSVEEVTTARKNLMTVQDELIKKFGTEKDAINLITEAVNGQTNAFDKLSQKQWQEVLNNFNDIGFWNGLSNFFNGYSDNIDRMLDEYGNYTAKINLDKYRGTNHFFELIDFLKTIGGVEFKTDRHTHDLIAEISGNATEVYEKLLAIQTLADDFNFNDDFSNHLTKLALSAKNISEQYEGMYNQYILYEKVFKSENYTEAFHEITKAYGDYQDAFTSGDENAINQALISYSNIVTAATNEALENGDTSVADYFKNMYPTMQSIVDQWEFKTKIIPAFDTTELTGKTEVDILEMLQTEGIQDGEETFNSIIESAKEYGFITDDSIESIQAVIDLLVELGYVQGDLQNTELSITDVFSLSDVQNNATALSELNDELSELQSAYSTCLSAKEEFDEQGYLSVDTLQKVLALGGEYLQYLFDEEGNVRLDAEAFQELALAKIDVMEANALSTLEENIRQITDEASATDYLAQKNHELADSYKDAAFAALAEMAALEGFNDSEAMQQAYDSYMAQYNQITNLFANARAGVSQTYSGKSKASSDSSSKKAETDWKSMLDNETTLLEKQLESALITFQEYVEKRRKIIEEYYRDGKISAKDYYDALEKMYDYQKSIYDKVLSAVTKRFDREIDLIQDSIDAIEKQNETLEKKKDEYDTILSVVDSVYEKEIENIRSQQDAIQDTIDALQEENDERKFALQLEQAKWELYRAQTQRTKKVFNGTEFIYDTDKDAIRDAQENLADLTLEQTVDGLEKEKDALDAVIEELEYYRDIWSEISGIREKSKNEQLAIALWGEDYEKLILSNRLSDIENFKDNYLSTQQQLNNNQTLIDSYNEKIEYYEALKESWNSITNAYETAMNEQMAAQVLGADWESQILSGRLETLRHFRDEYIAIQQAITDATFNAANVSVEPAGNTGNTSSTNNFSDKKKGPDDDNEKPTIVPNEWYDPVTKKFGTGTPPKYAHNVMMKYGRGTDDAKEGYHLIAETGTEIIRDNYGNAVIAKGKQLHHFDGGETVFSPSETQELLSGDLIPLDTAPTLKRPSDIMLEQWQKIVPDLSDRLLPATAALLTAHQFTETHSQSTPVVQNITLTLPNVTNNSGYERIKKELRQMQIDAYQNAHRRNP